METEQLKMRRKAQALEGIALLAEAAKDLSRFVKKVSYYFQTHVRLPPCEFLDA